MVEFASKDKLNYYLNTGTSLIYGATIVQTTTANSTLTIQNPTGNSTALTITPNAGGTRAASAHLIIEQIG